MKRIFGMLFCITFIWAIVGIFILIWDFNFYDLKVDVSMWLATWIFFTLDEIIIEKYGK